jgi:hypothetical protein
LPVADEPEPESEPKDPKKPRKLGGFKIFRAAVLGKIGYTNGSSEKNGIFDRQKSIDDSIMNGMPTMSGAGDLGKTQFGGFMGGFEADLEVAGINVLLDFHKFFRPGGMWSLLIGYDHEIGLGKRLRLDVGLHLGMMRIFLGDALANLYYDKTNPMAVNIATAGMEMRLMAALQIRLIGPLFTGPALMGGYHYLWTANASEITKEKGLHYSGAWTLRLDFAIRPE